MYRLEFPQAYDYSSAADGIVLPVVLRSSSLVVRAAANLDTGSSFCLFGAEIADALGLDLEQGVRTRFRTANSQFDAFGHEVELTVLSLVTHSVVYFFADPAIDKNVLGRNGWLDRVRVGLVHHASTIYLRPFD